MPSIGGLISVMFQRVWIIVLLALAALTPALLPSPVIAQTNETSVLSVSPTTRHLNLSFTIQLVLNLSSSEAFNVYDLQLSYNSTVLSVTSLVTAGSLETSRCIDGVGSGCNISDTRGVVHSAAGFTSTIYGQTSFTLFSVQFSIVGKGISLFHPFNDTLINPNLGNPRAILHLTQDGIYSNDGVTAFFNVAPAILIVNHPVLFDGSKSFNPDGTGIASFSWNFTDGSPIIQGTTASQVSHNFTSVGNHSVVLTVTDQKGSTGKMVKTISVGSGLGGIKISIRSSAGGNVPNAVTVSLYNGTIFVENATKPAFTNAIISFPNLSPGTYRVNFAGPGVVSSSLQETVIPGWTTFDTAFLTLIKPPSNDAPNLVLLFSLAAVGGGVALGTVAVLHRRNIKKPRAPLKARAISRWGARRLPGDSM